LANAQNTEESTPCAVSTKTKPDSRGGAPRIHGELLKLGFMRTSFPGMARLPA
jgi:hypothetical protein